MRHASAYRCGAWTPPGHFDGRPTVRATEARATMSQRERLEVLDILRGISVIGMLMDIVPGSWDYRFFWLNHADWRGYPIADMVFPTFLFCVGFALVFSLTRRLEKGHGALELAGHLARRGSLLIVLGLLANAIPTFDWANLRIPGVLQRIGLCWIAVAMLLIWLEKKRSKEADPRLGGLLLVAGGISVLYWALLQFVPVPGFNSPAFDSVGSWPTYLDRQIFGVAHLWPYGTTDGVVTYDPEGLLASLPACINVLAGSILGVLVLKRSAWFRGRALLGCGLGLIALGLALDALGIVPIIKKIWTPSFALLSVGFTLTLLAGLKLAIRSELIRRLCLPFRIYGANALLGFSVPVVFGPLLDIPLPGREASTREIGFEHLWGLMGEPRWASLSFTLIYVLGFGFILWYMDRRKVYWKL